MSELSEQRQSGSQQFSSQESGHQSQINDSSSVTESVRSKQYQFGSLETVKVDSYIDTLQDKQNSVEFLAEISKVKINSDLQRHYLQELQGREILTEIAVQRFEQCLLSFLIMADSCENSIESFNEKNKGEPQGHFQRDKIKTQNLVSSGVDQKERETTGQFIHCSFQLLTYLLHSKAVKGENQQSLRFLVGWQLLFPLLTKTEKDVDSFIKKALSSLLSGEAQDRQIAENLLNHNCLGNVKKPSQNQSQQAKNAASVKILRNKIWMQSSNKNHFTRIIVNPKFRDLLQEIKQADKQNTEVDIPEVFIISESNLLYILSFILYQSRLISAGFNVKLVTTRAIYNSYLEVFAFIKATCRFISVMESLELKAKSAQEIHLTQMRGSFYPKNEYENELQKLNALEKIYLLEKFFKDHLEEEKQFISEYVPLYIEVVPETFFSLDLSFSLCFRKTNLWCALSYDVELIENGRILAMFQSHNISDIKSIYYRHKEGTISEDAYVQIAKRLSYKAENQSQMKKLCSNTYVSKQSSKIHQINDHDSAAIISVTLQQSSEEFKASFYSLDMASLSVQESKSKVKLLHDPWQMEYNIRNKAFQFLRSNPSLLFMSDNKLRHLLRNSSHIVYTLGQTVTNRDSFQEFMYLVLEGECFQDSGDTYSQNKVTVGQGSLFIWSLTLSDSFGCDSSSSSTGSKVKRINLLKVKSEKCSVLRIQVQHFLMIAKTEMSQITGIKGKIQVVNQGQKASSHQRTVDYLISSRKCMTKFHLNSDSQFYLLQLNSKLIARQLERVKVLKWKYVKDYPILSRQIRHIISNSFDALVLF